MASCTMSLIDAVRLFLLYGVDVNFSDFDGRTGLSIACEHGYDDLAQLLLNQGADLNLTQEGSDRTRPLLVACVHGRISTVKLLLEIGADINHDGAVSSLIIACALGYFDVVKLLLKYGADVNIASSSGRIPLMEAAIAYRKDKGLIDLLLEYGADINAESDGVCALGYACLCHKRENVKLLIERGADLYKADGVTRIAHSTSDLLTTDPEIISLVEQYREVNKRANRAFKPLLK